MISVSPLPLNFSLFNFYDKKYISHMHTMLTSKKKSLILRQVSTKSFVQKSRRKNLHNHRKRINNKLTRIERLVLSSKTAPVSTSTVTPTTVFEFVNSMNWIRPILYGLLGSIICYSFLYTFSIGPFQSISNLETVIDQLQATIQYLQDQNLQLEANMNSNIRSNNLKLEEINNAYKKTHQDYIHNSNPTTQFYRFLTHLMATALTVALSTLIQGECNYWNYYRFLKYSNNNKYNPSNSNTFEVID